MEEKKILFDVKMSGGNLGTKEFLDDLFNYTLTCRNLQQQLYCAVRQFCILRCSPTHNNVQRTLRAGYSVGYTAYHYLSLPTRSLRTLYDFSIL